MISNISGSKYIEVRGSGTTYVNKQYSSNQFMTGDMRYDLDSQSIKVFDGQSWQTMITHSVSVGLNGEAEMLLDWAREKRWEEQRIRALADKHPTVADAIAKAQHAEEQVRIAAALVDNA